MKYFFKIFFTLIMAVFLLGAGYYLVLSNLSYLLAAGKPNFRFQNISNGFLVKTGAWVEKVSFKAPIEVLRKDGVLILKSQRLAIIVSTKPKFRIEWEKNF